jgi:hypothetical protein
MSCTFAADRYDRLVRYAALLISSVHLFHGTRCFLNVIGVLQTSRYALATTASFGALFLGFGLTSGWFATWGENVSLAMWLAAGPWVLALLVLIVSLVFSPRQ